MSVALREQACHNTTEEFDAKFDEALMMMGGRSLKTDEEAQMIDNGAELLCTRYSSRLEPQHKSFSKSRRSRLNKQRS